MRFPRLPRKTAIASGVLVAALAAPAIAWAVVPELPASSTFTACLRSGGGIVKAKEGSAPVTPCVDGEKQIKLSGGDITSVNAGLGLGGSTSSGNATLEIQPKYRLPQSCTPGADIRMNGALDWVCGPAPDLRPTYHYYRGLAGNPVGNNWANAASINVPVGGKYRVDANIDVVNGAPPTSIYVQCRIDTAAKLSIDESLTSVQALWDRMHLSAIVDVPTGSYVAVVCRDEDNGDVKYRKVDVSLTPVAGSVTEL